MIPYWIMLLVPAYAALTWKPPRHTGLALYGLILALFIGGRYEVGADWYTYQFHFDRVSLMSFRDIAASGDPGYYLLNWIAFQLGLNVIWSNVFGGLIFSWGLISLARVQPNPWLALTVALPYLVIVVAMGYSRQGIAIGMVMLGLAKLYQGSVVKFAIAILVAAAFHKTAIVIFPILALSQGGGRLWNIAWIAALMAFSYLAFLDSSVDVLVKRYIESSLESEGVYVRLAMNAMPSIILIVFRKRFNEKNIRFWIYMSYASLLMIPSLLFLSSTTVVDRLSLYLIPIQVYVLSRLPYAAEGWRGGNQFLCLMVVLYSIAVQFVWLNFASHSFAWVPYRFYWLSAGP